MKDMRRSETCAPANAGCLYIICFIAVYLHQTESCNIKALFAPSSSSQLQLVQHPIWSRGREHAGVYFFVLVDPLITAGKLEKTTPAKTCFNNLSKCLRLSRKLWRIHVGITSSEGTALLRPHVNEPLLFMADSRRRLSEVSCAPIVLCYMWTVCFAWRPLIHSRTSWIVTVRLTGCRDGLNQSGDDC